MWVGLPRGTATRSVGPHWKQHRNAIFLTFSDFKKKDILATDGSIGSLIDLLVDERTLETIYAVVDTGSWLPGRRVLIPPVLLKSVGPDGVRVDLSMEDIKAQPGLASHPPVGLESRAMAYRRYHWRTYAWGGVLGIPGNIETPDSSEAAVNPDADIEPVNHSRSLAEMEGYHIHALDGEVGHIEDYLFSVTSWNPVHIVVDTKNWLPGRKVVVPSEKFEDVSWADRKVKLSLTREEVMNAPTRDSVQESPKAPGSRVLNFLSGM